MKNKNKNIKKTLFLGVSLLVVAIVFVSFGAIAYYYKGSNSLEKKRQSILEEPRGNDFANKSKEEILNALSQRKELLLKEIEKDPSAIKKYALPKEVRDKLPEEAKGLVEQEVEITGKLTVLIADDFKNKKSTISYKLEDSKKYDVKFIEKPQNLKSSESVTAKGLALGSTLVLDSGEAPSLSINAPPRKGLTGAQDSLVLRFNWQNDTSEPFSAAAIDTQLYSGANSTDAYYQENSYSLLSFPGNTSNVTTAWYTIAYNKNSGCSSPDITNWTLAATNAATTAGYVLGNYDNIIYLFPSNSSCGWAGLGEVGGGLTWINGYNDSSLYSHELGHNIGEGHASSKDCGTKAIDSYANCTNSEYGDDYDVMGGSWENYHFNASFKNDSGWIPPGEIQTVSSSGTYTLNTLENAASATKAIKIQKPDTSEYYWLEYRQATGFDSSLPSGVTRGLIVHVFDGISGNNSYLLDMTPANDWSDVALSDGTTFTDNANNISVTQLSHSTNAVSVFISFGNPYNYNLVSLGLPPAYMDAGTTQVVSVTLQNTGTATWYNESQNPSYPTRLQVINNDGKNFYTTSGNWVEDGSKNRIKMATASVSPGANGTFTFTIKAPPPSGYHSIHFIPIVENLTQLPQKPWMYMSMTTN